MPGENVRQAIVILRQHRKEKGILGVARNGQPDQADALL